MDDSLQRYELYLNIVQKKREIIFSLHEIVRMLLLLTTLSVFNGQTAEIDVLPCLYFFAVLCLMMLYAS